MKLNSKQISIALFILGAACLIARFVLCYLYGYTASANVSPIVKDILLWLIGFFILLAQVYVWIASLFRRYSRLFTTTILIGLFSLKLIENIVPRPTDLILYGMRDRILQRYSLDDLRRFAKEFDKLSPLLVDSNTDYLIKKYSSADLAMAGLENKYSFLLWFNDSVREGQEYVTESNNQVSVSWGSRPRWGISVAVHGEKISPPIGSDAHILRVSDDIYLIIGIDY